VWDPNTNGYPQGQFEQDFPVDTLLKVSWACSILGSLRKGTIDADTWQAGKATRRQCLGVLKCTGIQCHVLLRPLTRNSSTKDPDICHLCHSRLEHIRCPIISTLYTWRGGIHYNNGGNHMHPHPPAKSMLPAEYSELVQVVTSNPTATAAQLRVGLPQLDGSTTPAGSISATLHNIDHLRYQRQRIHQSVGVHRRGDEFLNGFRVISKEDAATAGDYVQCSVCNRLSHLACQEQPKTSLLGLSAFRCHSAGCKARRSMLVSGLLM
jgi:hypothetical protein